MHSLTNYSLYSSEKDPLFQWTISCRRTDTSIIATMITLLTLRPLTLFLKCTFSSLTAV